MDEQSIIELKDVSFQYQDGEEFSLSEINLKIEKGDFIGIIGNSGAGKTSLTQVLSGVIPHHYRGDFYGMALVKGQDTLSLKPDELSQTIGSVFQDIDAQMVATIVEDELLFGLENFGVPRDEIEERLLEAMKLTGIEALRYRSIATLSGGQKQKVAIASIIALRPEILVLDEPTGELDPVSSRQIFEVLKELNETYGMTVIIVEQKVMLLAEYVKRLLVLEQGKIWMDGSVREVFKRRAELEKIGVHVPRVVSLHEQIQRKFGYDKDVTLTVDEAKQMVMEVTEDACI